MNNIVMMINNGAQNPIYMEWYGMVWNGIKEDKTRPPILQKTQALFQLYFIGHRIGLPNVNNVINICTSK